MLGLLFSSLTLVSISGLHHPRHQEPISRNYLTLISLSRPSHLISVSQPPHSHLYLTTVSPPSLFHDHLTLISLSRPFHPHLYLTTISPSSLSHYHLTFMSISRLSHPHLYLTTISPSSLSHDHLTLISVSRPPHPHLYHMTISLSSRTWLKRPSRLQRQGSAAFKYRRHQNL